MIWVWVPMRPWRPQGVRGGAGLQVSLGGSGFSWGSWISPWNHRDPRCSWRLTGALWGFLGGCGGSQGCDGSPHAVGRGVDGHSQDPSRSSRSISCSPRSSTRSRYRRPPPSACSTYRGLGECVEIHTPPSRVLRGWNLCSTHLWGTETLKLCLLPLALASPAPELPSAAAVPAVGLRGAPGWVLGEAGDPIGPKCLGALLSPSLPPEGLKCLGHPSFPLHHPQRTQASRPPYPPRHSGVPIP